MPRVRPTLRCLSEELELPVPPQTIPLDEIDHPLLVKANEQFGVSGAPRERISAIDDRQLFKVKVMRWRGAVWEEPDLGWLIAAGKRESGSPDDFYESLEAGAVAARKRYNASRKPALSSKTYVGHLLPDNTDRRRYAAEAEVRFDRLLEAMVHELLRASLRDGREHRATMDTFALGIQVRADEGHETWVAIRVSGSVPDNLTASIFDMVPGCDIGDWEYYGRLPERTAEPGEDVVQLDGPSRSSQTPRERLADHLRANSRSFDRQAVCIYGRNPATAAHSISVRADASVCERPGSRHTGHNE